MPTGKISIIVPIYNVEKELDRCVASILRQTYQNIEILLVDDGSPDNCPAMCDAYAQTDGRVVVIRKENGGLSSARNAGLRAATGEYVLYVDSDDYIEPDACERLAGEIAKGADIVSGKFREICGTQQIYRGHSNLVPGEIYPAREFVIRSIQAREWHDPAWLYLYRRDFLLEHQLFYAEGLLHEDMEMLPRLFLADPKVIYTDYAFYNYMIRENSITSASASAKRAESSMAIYREWKQLFDQVEDAGYQRYLYGWLSRKYIASARRLHIRGWKVDGLDYAFARRYSLDRKERIKAALFNYLPAIYTRI